MIALAGLLISTIALIFVNAGWGQRKEVPWAGGCVAAGSWIIGCSLYVAVVSGSLASIPLSILVLLLVWGKFFPLSARWMAIHSWSIYLIFWLASLGAYFPLQAQYEAWKRSVPLESIAERLPEPKPATLEPKPQTNSPGIFDEFAESYSRDYRSHRNLSIQFIHNSTLAAFDRAAGFGGIRMIVIHPKAEDFVADFTPPVPQPGPNSPPILSRGQKISSSDRPFVRQLHLESRLDFTNPLGSGFVKSRGEVAGFQSHRFSKVPKTDDGWKPVRIDLISLVMHEKPLVYISENLPRMQDIGNLKTRDLDDFEQAGLAHVRKTDELFMHGNENALRVIGALRSVKECQKCHGGQVGDLLGAFSYTLVKEKRAK